MENIIKTLEGLPDALRAWAASYQDELEKKDRRISELEQEVKRIAQAALPQVSVTGSLFDASEQELAVRWKVTSTTEARLKVNVRHTDINTGKEADYVWDVAKEARSVYTYPLEKLVSGKVSFAILPGEGYTIGTGTANVPVPVANTPPPVANTPPPAPKPELPKVLEQLEPLKITQGGTYEGKKITSTVSKVPCVELATAEEVRLVGLEFANAGHAIKNHSGKTNLKVIRCKASGLPHDGSMNDPRRFLSVNQIINLEVLNCETEHMGFLTTQGAFQGSGSQGIKVLHNLVRNVSGLKRGSRSHANFVQIMNSGPDGIPNVEIAYNGVYNEYGEADVEDNINIYNARGRKDAWMQIHSNLIYGAFYHPSQEAKKYYSGGGIITDGKGNEEQVPAYIDVYRNYIIATGNYSLGMASGHDLSYYENVVVNAATLPSGKPYSSIKAPNDKGIVTGMSTTGLWASNFYKGAAMYNNVMEGNTIGVNHYERRMDISEGAAKDAVFRGNVSLPDPITKELEQKYIAEWEAMYRGKIGV